MYAGSWPSRGGGGRGLGSPNGWGGGGPPFLFCSAAGEFKSIEGGSEDSVRIVEWSGVFNEEVEAFRMWRGFSNGLSIVDAEFECVGLNLRSMVGVLAPEGGGVRSRSSRGKPSSPSLSGST